MVLLYSDVAQVTGYIIVISLLGVVLHIGVMAMPPPGRDITIMFKWGFSLTHSRISPWNVADVAMDTIGFP